MFRVKLLPVLVGFILLNGCSSTAVNNKKIIEAPTTSDIDIENYHIVKRSESLYAIARMYGRDHKDLARWNNIPPPYALNIGQRLILDGSPADEPEISTPIVEAPPVPEGSHRVAAGEGLFSIAQKYNVNWKELAKWNNIQEPYAVNIGQILVVVAPIGQEIANNDPIPITIPTVIQPAPSNDKDYHIVLKGDNLFKIAKHYGHSMADLAKWNNIPAPFSVRLGQKLRVTPPEGVVDNTLPSALPSVSNSDYHIVQAKDTLYSISKIYKISAANLKLWNKLQPPFNVFIGQKLRITAPATSSSGGLRPVGFTPRYHIVRKGEKKLKQIAQKYGLSVSDLAKWNGIGSPPNIYPGQRLKLTPR